MNPFWSGTAFGLLVAFAGLLLYRLAYNSGYQDGHTRGSLDARLPASRLAPPKARKPR